VQKNILSASNKSVWTKAFRVIILGCIPINCGKKNSCLAQHKIHPEEKKMATKEAFSAEEWNLIRMAPILVMTGVAASDPGGLIGAFQESYSGVKTMMNSFKENSSLGLMSALMAEKSMPTMPDRKQMLGEGSTEQQSANFKNAVLGYVKQAIALIKSKGSPEEVAAYEKMMSQVADHVANAAKEGSFFGFGGERVSAGEKAFLDELNQAMQA
jgi:hypothetical protein